MPSPREALEAFADAEQNPDLTRLESLLSRFNLFEAVGVVRQELRHSNLLAFLLDPSQSHGLGTAFLKELLQAVLLTTEGDNAVSPSDLDVWDLSQAVVQREWRHIDILVLDDVNRFAVLIENKVDTGEHSDQLERYYAEFHSHYPSYKVLALFLTRDGSAPSSAAYHAVSYTLVCEGIEKIVRDRRSTLDGEVVMLLEHYAQMLRRHIVSDSDVAELCRVIYQKHRQALDLIFDHRPDQQMLIRESVRSLIAQEPSMKPHNFGRGYINFGLRQWDTAPARHRIEHEEGRWLPYLCVSHFMNGLWAGMWIGSGNEEDRAKLLQMAKRHHFTGVAKKLTGVWSRASTFQLLNTRDYERTQEDLETLIPEKWVEFMYNELPRISEAIREEKWLWEMP